MKYNFNYKNGVKLNIWMDETPIPINKEGKEIRKKYEITSDALSAKQIVLELQIPRNCSNYGLLGLKYTPKKSGAEINIRVSDYTEEIYKENISIKPDIVHKGIPMDYVDAIIRCVEEVISSNNFKSGIYNFNIGAHGEVGSSDWVFYTLTSMSLKMLYRNYINKDIVKEIIDNEIY